MSHPPPASVIVHPLVLLSVVDHWRRVARDTRKRVVGVLLGERLGSGATARVDVTNSFAGERSGGIGRIARAATPRGAPAASGGASALASGADERVWPIERARGGEGRRWRQGGAATLVFAFDRAHRRPIPPARGLSPPRPPRLRHASP